MKRRNFSILLVFIFMFSVIHVTSFTGSVAANSTGLAEWPGDSREEWSFNRLEEWERFAYVDNDSVQLVIGLKDDIVCSFAKFNEIIVGKGGTILDTLYIGKHRTVLIDVPLQAVSSLATEIIDADFSRYMEPNFKVQASFIPDDPCWNLQWGPKKIEADWAWNTTTGNHRVLIAVVDSGVDYNHTDLKANYAFDEQGRPLGYDWVNNDPYPIDDYGHGTHVAGIIAAELNNRIGIAGLCQVQIMAEKVINAYNQGYDFNIAQGITHAVNQSAKIINLSFGGFIRSPLEEDAVKYAYDHGVLVIAAAGNEATSSKSFPAAFNEVIAVTATNKSDVIAPFSNFGSWIDFAAPGVHIYSTMPTYHVTLNDPPYNKSLNYDFMGGTSMATPHVSAVAALILSSFPNMTLQQVWAQLRYAADDLGDPGFDKYYGWGRINARKAVEQTPTDHDLLVWNLEILATEPGNRMNINSTIFNMGKNNETDVTVKLIVNGSLVDSKLIGYLPCRTLATVNHS